MITVPAPTSIVPVLLRLSTMTVKAGTRNFDKQIGTGPFKLESYSNGNARLVRNDAWHLGVPLLDAVEITRFDSVGALSNAVLSGQVDLASNVGAIAGRSAEGREDVQVVRRPDDVVVPIVMRTSDGPFTDPRVREAIQLGADEKHSSPRRCRGWARCRMTSSARATRTLTAACRSGSATSSAPRACWRKRTSTHRRPTSFSRRRKRPGRSSLPRPLRCRCGTSGRISRWCDRRAMSSTSQRGAWRPLHHELGYERLRHLHGEQVHDLGRGPERNGLQGSRVRCRRGACSGRGGWR